MRLLDFNGELRTASVITGGIEFAYQSNSRAMAVLDRTPRRLAIDGVEVPAVLIGNVLILPRGQHLITIVA
jgi:hypothetical protein